MIRRSRHDRAGIPHHSDATCPPPAPPYRPANHGRTNEVYGDLHNPEAECAITAPATPEAAKWTGWAMALKPAWVGIIVRTQGLGKTEDELREELEFLLNLSIRYCLRGVRLGFGKIPFSLLLGKYS